MSAEKKISNLLGIPQRILALLLNVKRSQFSMYELGLRSLPSKALLKIAELVKVVQINEYKTIASSLTAEEMMLYQVKLQKLLEENDYQQQVLSRKIEALEKKCQNRAKLLQLIHHLESKGKTETPQETLGLDLLQVTSNSAKKYVFEMLDHQMQLQFLQQQAQVVRKELGEWSKGSAIE
jgi:transcriptional regulator with XRE-family HTH domain